ncbi:MAG: GntR family transcriptional regulator [Solirubrobacteraceae bacterium]
MSAIQRIDRSHSWLAGEVYDRLVEALVQGAVNPGDRLIQDRLAEELDVSRTPVREALLRLKDEGVLEPSGRRGYVVRRLTEADLRDLYGARDAVEGHAAAIIAEVGGAALQAVRDALAQAVARRPRSSREAFDANRLLHRTIVEQTRNAYLLSFFDAIWGRAITAVAYHDFYVRAPHDEFIAEHEALIEQLATGDPTRARRAMVEHIAWGLERNLKGATAKRRGSRSGRAGREPDVAEQ